MFDYILLTFCNSTQHNGDVSPESCVGNCLAYSFPVYCQFMIVSGVFYLYVFVNVGGERYSPPYLLTYSMEQGPSWEAS